MRILAVCGMGLGTSLILKLNIQSALRELGVAGVEVAHGDLASRAFEKADLIVVAQDLQANCENRQAGPERRCYHPGDAALGLGRVGAAPTGGPVRGRHPATVR